MRQGFFYFVASHRFRQDRIDEYPQLFLYRSVDGFIMVNARWHSERSIPVVTVSSQHSVKQVTSIVIDHPRAVAVAWQHLIKLGHRKIAFIKASPANVDAAIHSCYKLRSKPI